MRTAQDRTEDRPLSQVAADTPPSAQTLDDEPGEPELSYGL